MKEIFLNFKLNGVEVQVERANNILAFKATKDDEDILLDVTEVTKYRMYRFNIFNDTCIIGFDEADNICLHIIKENKKEHIYYSLSEDDKNMYTIEELKKIYRYRCESKIQEMIEEFEALIKDISDIHLFKNILFNNVKNKFYKGIDPIMSMYIINLYEAQYIQDIKQANDNAIDAVKDLKFLHVKELKKIINKK